MKKKILLVEDEKDLLDELADWLRFEQYDVLMAANGEEGLKMALQHEPDLIVSDIMMPKIDGTQLLYRLRSHETTRITPFIFMSAIAERKKIRSAFELGADDYLTKPFSHKEFLNAIKIRLEKQEHMKKETEFRLDDLRNRIIGTLPHELRTPLNGIIGFSSLLADDPTLFSYNEIADMGKSIQASGIRLHRLVENYLLFVQLEMFNPRPEVMLSFESITTIVNDVVNELGLKYGRELDIRIDLANEGVWAPGDFLRKTVYELLDNALKFSTENTRVVIAGQREKAGYRLTVSDQGTGMTAEQIASLGAYMQFERDKIEQQGNGLGLALVSKLMKSLGGNLDIESVPGEGTRVHCLFSRREGG